MRTTSHRTSPSIRSRRRPVWTSLALGGLVLATAACGSDDDASTEGTAAPSAADATTPPADTTAPTDTAANSDTGTSDTATSDTATSDTATPDTTATSDTTASTDTAAPSPSGVASDDPFCVAAQEADDAGDAVDFQNSTPEELRAEIEGSLEAGQEALALAPDEIRDTTAAIVDFQQQIVDLLRASDYDFVAVAQSPEFTAIVNDPELEQAGTDLDVYLQENCGITQD